MSSSATPLPSARHAPGPLHAILLAGSVPLFLGALLNDIAYFYTHQIQWSNFASWLIVGALVFCGFALLFALVRLLRAPRKAGRPLLVFLMLLATWVLGLLNAFQHAKDAWAVMPGGLVLSAIVSLSICIAAWVGLGTRSGEAS